MTIDEISKCLVMEECLSLHPRTVHNQANYNFSPPCWMCTSGEWRIHRNKLKFLNCCEKNLSFSVTENTTQCQEQFFTLRPAQTQGLWSWTSRSSQKLIHFTKNYSDYFSSNATESKVWVIPHRPRIPGMIFRLWKITEVGGYGRLGRRWKQ